MAQQWLVVADGAGNLWGSIGSTMQFQVTYIEFDTQDDDEMTAYDKDKLNSEYIGTIWDADDEDDLVEEITCASGWCIKSIDYRHILS